MPLNQGAVSQIKPFAPEGQNVLDLLSLEEYEADLMRLRGHQDGLARRDLENRVLRQVSHIAAGLAQFIANRHAPGVVDDADLDKVETGIAAAVHAIASALVALEAASRAAGDSYLADIIDSHRGRVDNPHAVTKTQVGLGSVQNYALATQAEAEAGTANNKYMSPVRTKQSVDVHANQTGPNSPHGATPSNVVDSLVKRDALGRFKAGAPAASEDVARKAEVDVVQGNLDTHAGLTGASNPHGATSAATANAVVRRDASGRARFSAPSHADDAARKADVDGHANASGAAAPHGATPDNIADALVKRDALGRFRAAAPSANDDVARLAEVLSRLALAGGTLTGPLVISGHGVHPLATNTRVAATAITDYPVGLSVMNIGTANGAGWPFAFGSALTCRADSASPGRSWQLLHDSHTNNFWLRGWSNTTGVWLDPFPVAGGGRGDAAKATDSDKLGGVDASGYARIDVLEPRAGDLLLLANDVLTRVGEGYGGRNVWLKMKDFKVGLPGVYRVTYFGYALGGGYTPLVQLRTSEGWQSTQQQVNNAGYTITHDVAIAAPGATIEVWGYSNSSSPTEGVLVSTFKLSVKQHPAALSASLYRAV